jgi:hypothetical protein
MGTVIRLVAMPEETGFAPLGVLGYCLTRSKFLEPVWAKLDLPIKAVDHEPEEKLQDILVSILTGCRSISQVNTRLRPDLALASAWGRSQFAEQSILARTLDAFESDHNAQLRQGFEVLLRQESQVFRHSFGDEWLYLDIDLTPLPSSKHAEGSTKGKFEKKTATGANWHAYMRRSTMKHCCLASTSAKQTVDQPTSLRSRRSRARWTSHLSNEPRPSCVPTPVSAAMPTLIGRFRAAGRF